MSCRRFRKSLIEYVDGELPDARAEEVRKHVEGCETCKAAVEKLEFSSSALASLDPVGMPEASAGRIAAALRTSADSARPAFHSVSSRLGFFTTYRGLASAGVVAALIIAVAIVVVAFSGTGNVPKSQLATGTVPINGTSPAAGFTTSPGQTKSENGIIPGAVASIMPVVKASDTMRRFARPSTTLM